MDVERRDVVVIGAGPGGSSAARAAALGGLRPLLVERAATVGETNACGGFAAHALRRKLGLPPEVVDCEPKRTLVVIDGRPYVYGNRNPHYISFRRTLFDSYLAGRAAEAGAELVTGTCAAVIAPARRRVRLTERRTGAERVVEARVIIFADGPATMAADACGIGHRPGPRTRTGIVFELDGTWGDGETSELCLSTKYVKGYFWIFPKRDCVWVGVGGTFSARRPGEEASMADPTPDSAPLHRRLTEFIAGRDDLRGRSLRHRGAGLVPADLSRRLVADGAMVVGDAAGLVNPMTGGGIAFALASGEIAGRVAAEAVRAGRTDAAFLARYQRRFRRTPHWAWLLAMTAWRRSLERKPLNEQPLAYARMLRRYMNFFHHARLVVDLVLGA